MNAHLVANARPLVAPSAPIDRSFRAVHGMIVVTGARSPPEKAATVRTVVPCATGHEALVQPDRGTAPRQTSLIGIKRQTNAHEVRAAAKTCADAGREMKIVGPVGETVHRVGATVGLAGTDD